MPMAPLHNSQSMWRSTVVLLCCSIFASILLSIVWMFRAPPLVLASEIGLAWFTGVLIFMLLIRRRSSSELWSCSLFLATILMGLFLIGFNHAHYIRQTIPFQPFIGIKIISIF